MELLYDIILYLIWLCIASLVVGVVFGAAVLPKSMTTPAHRCEKIEKVFIDITFYGFSVCVASGMLALVLGCIHAMLTDI